jgi:hypothetical protein
MTIVNPLDLDAIYLKSGGHNRTDVPITDQEMCVMEAVSYLAGEPWSDHPKCASPVIAAFCRSWNDATDDEGREALKAYIPRLIGSVSSQQVENARGWMATDWLIHTYLPLWLRVAGLEDQAVRCERLPVVDSQEAWLRQRFTVADVREKAWAQRSGWYDRLRDSVRIKVKEGLERRGLPVAAEAAGAAEAAVAAGAAGAAEAAGAAVAAGAADWSVGSPNYWAIRNAVRDSLKGTFKAAVEEKAGTELASSKASALDLLDRMLDLTEVPA